MSKTQQEPAAAAANSAPTNGKSAPAASAAAVETATGDEGPLTMALQVVEKKVRNLEKRKVSLTGKYRQRKRGNVLERSHPVFRHCQKFWRFRRENRFRTFRFTL